MKIFLFLVLSLASSTTHAQCELAKVTASSGAAGDEVGRSVAISGDWAVVGAPLSDIAAPDAGAACVFRRQGVAWQEVAVLTAADADGDEEFGSSVAIDGAVIVIGAPLDADFGLRSGSGYVFELQDGAWAQTTKLVASDVEPFAEFGSDVAISGPSFVVGARRSHEVAIGAAGAYVFEQQGTTWVETAKVVASDGALEDWFGTAVDIEGETMVVGATEAEFGAAYVFERKGGVWVETQKLKPLPFAISGSGMFGGVVAIRSSTIAVGASYDGPGSVWLFERSSDTWTLVKELLASDGAIGDFFGYALALDGDRLLVGAAGTDQLGIATGSVYWLERSSTGWVEKAKFMGADTAGGDGFGISVAQSGDSAVIGALNDQDLGLKSGSAYLFGLSLCSDVDQISLSAGGAQPLSLDAGLLQAGDIYFVGGSLHGTSPGFAFGGFSIPLNPDSYLLFTLNHPNTPLLKASLGFLDPAGKAVAELSLGPATNPALAGLTATHAFAAFDPALGAVSMVSNPISVLLVP